MDFETALIHKKEKNKVLKVEHVEHEKVCVSHIKRFMERWIADPDFRDLLFIDSCKAVVHHNIKVDAEEIRPLWDIEFASKHSEEVPISTSLKHWQKLVNENPTSGFMRLIAASSSNQQFKAWRERQIARTTSQFKKWLQDALVHAPVCFELSKGCSIGCYFCGVSAPRLGDIFFYEPQNKKLWREVLELMKEVLGPAAGAGFCYWANRSS